MALIVEDGSIVKDATSYVSLDDFKAYAELRNIALPTNDAAIVGAIVRGFDYIESWRDRFRGEPLSGLAQAAAWPRTGADMPAGVPGAIRLAQLHAAAYALDNALDGTYFASAERITSETVGPISTDYADNVGSSDGAIVATPYVDKLLKKWCNKSGFTVSRV